MDKAGGGGVHYKRVLFEVLYEVTCGLVVNSLQPIGNNIKKHENPVQTPSIKPTIQIVMGLWELMTPYGVIGHYRFDSSPRFRLPLPLGDQPS